MEDDFLVLNIREYIKMGKAGEEPRLYIRPDTPAQRTLRCGRDEGEYRRERGKPSGYSCLRDGRYKL